MLPTTSERNILFAVLTIEGYRLQVLPDSVQLLDTSLQYVLNVPLLDIRKVSRKTGLGTPNGPFKLYIETNNERKHLFTFEINTVTQTLKNLIKFQMKRIVSNSPSRIELPSSSWIIPFEQLVMGDIVGKGSGGQVIKGRWNDERVAIKRIPLLGSEEDEILFCKEIECLITLRHPSCIRFYGVSFDTEDIPHLVMEYCDKGTLMDMIEGKDKRLLSWTFILSILHDVARGLRFIHSCGIIHRDIKPANIMIASSEYKADRDQSMVRIVDYGISKTLNGRASYAKTLCGSSGYMAPEVFDAKYTFSSDIFGFGVMMYLLIFKKNPFPIESFWEYKETLAEKKPLVLPSQIPDDIADLLTQTLSFVPHKRPDFIHICEVIKSALDPEGQ